MSGKSETVTAGRDTIGKVISLERGHEAYTVADGYLATYPTVQAARKAIWQHHQSSQVGR